MLTPKQVTDFMTQLMTNPVWFDDGAFKLYLYCLAKASPNEYEWKGIQLRPGDLPFSERYAADTLHWSRNKLRRKMGILESLGLITVQSEPLVGTMIHVVGWPCSDTTCPQVASKWSSQHRGWPQNDTTFQRPPSDDASEMEPAWSGNEHQTEPDRSQNPEIRQRPGPTAAHNSYIKRDPPHIYDMYGAETEPERFSEIWLAYPEHRRAHRREAAELVAKALEEGATIDILLAALEADKQTPDWLTNSGQYIPGIVKWLQREAWRKYLPSDLPEDEEEEWETR